MSLKLIAALLVATLVVAGGLGSWWFTRDTGPEPVEYLPPPVQEPDGEPPPQNWTLTGRLRPGSQLGSYCTLNFIFVYPDGKLAMGTAGHCNEVNDTVSNPEVGEFGIVVYSVNDFGGRGLDFALIDLYEEQFPEANPQVRRWGGPTNFTTSDQTSTTDLIDVYGYAAFAGETEETRARTGALYDDDDKIFSADIPVWWGDSGGPLVMDDDRAALGVVSRLGDDSSLDGSTVECVLRNLHADGFPVELVTAPPL